MKFPRVRFTVRRMMAAVAVVAVAVLTLVKPHWDRARWGHISEGHLRQANFIMSRASSVGESDPDAAERLLTRFKWHQSMAARYARAAAYPGMPPPTDTPP
jgi:hypothetical protein